MSLGVPVRRQYTYGHMKKDVDNTLKWIMITSTMVAIKHDPHLKSLNENTRNHTQIR